MLTLDPERRITARQALQHSWLTADAISNQYAKEYDEEMNHAIDAAIVEGKIPNILDFYPETISEERKRAIRYACDNGDGEQV